MKIFKRVFNFDDLQGEDRHYNTVGEYITVHKFATGLPDRYAWKTLEEIRLRESESLKYIFKIHVWNEKKGER